MPTRLISIPFALGQDEETAPRELPLGPLREAVNVRQRRGKSFGVRADYTAALMTEFDGTLVPYGLYNLNGRLLALGDRLFAGFPSDLFEYVQQPGGAWKGTLAVGATGTRVPPITRLRNVGQVPDSTSQVQAARVAAVNGLVCLVYGFGSPTGGATSYVHIFRADTDATVLLQAISASNARPVAVGNSFWILGVDAGNDVIGFRFNTLADDSLQASVVLYAGTVTSGIFDGGPVGGASQFIFAARDGSTTAIRVFTEAGAVFASWAGPAVASDTLVIEADSVAGQAVIATRVGAADVQLTTYHLPTSLVDPATILAGPTAVFGEAVTGSMSLTRNGLGTPSGQLFSEDTGNRVLCARIFFSTHVRTLKAFHNYALAGQGVNAACGPLTPVRSGDFSNQIVIADLLDTSSIYAAAQADAHIANPLIGAVGKGGNICLDASTGLFYWSRIVEGTDGQTIPIVAEFAAASTARRQACQVGNELFVAGAMPLSFDGRAVVESGFLERPVFVSSTPGVIGGSLVSGATYDWVAIYAFTNSQNRIIRSQVSDIQTLTLSATQNGVTFSIFAPHTLRKQLATGSVPTISVYRTDATALATTVEITGTEVVNPPSASLNGQSLQFFVTDTIGTTPFVVTFGVGDTTPAAISATINAVTTTRLTAAPDAGRIKLTVTQTGAGVLLQIFGTTGATILGFPANTTVEGETTFVRGSIFHLAATAVVPASNELGQAVTVIDTKSDATLLLAETLYTQGEQGDLTGILEREAPPSCDFCCAVGSRAFLGGLPDRSEVAISFALAPAEALAFSSTFSFRANVDGDVTAVASLDGVPIAFTKDSIYSFNSQLPNDQGADGELGPPVRIPSEGGCDNANSIIETSMGLFYQARDTKLMLLPRGRGAAPTWIGKLVQDALVSFPTVTGVAYADEDHCILFTCQNAGGTASTILVFDLRIGQWYRDTFASAQVIKAPVEYLGRLAYIDGVTVRLQSSSLTPATFIPWNAKTGSLMLFGGPEWGKLVSITVEGEQRGACQLRARISYDDGVTFTNMKTFTLTQAVGTSVCCQWWPNIRKGTAFVLDFQVLTNGSATEGVILNHYTLEVEQAAPVARRRTSTAERG
jgi:hypothetical protein